jgi:superfamily I DNA/RNA helicase
MENLVTPEELKAHQIAERTECLRRILASTAPKKIIVAGPGAGKTFTFSEIFKLDFEGSRLAMTFIRKLTEDMQESFGNSVEVKTFHAFCKKHLHEIYGKFDIRPYFTKLIEKDASVLGNGLGEFDEKFEMLEEGQEIQFYLRQGDYYGVSGFNDSVYRLLSYVRAHTDYMPQFGCAVVDEYQDFNKLEVEFLNALETRGPILIVGDDDQAVYSLRNSTPTFLRDKYTSGGYEVFELPYCGRCTEAVVKATNSIIHQARVAGLLSNRIEKRFEYFIKDKEADSRRYPKITVATVTTGGTLAKYIEKKISQIPSEEIAESHDKKYPTVLIIGPKQYLALVAKDFKKKEIPFQYEPSEVFSYSLVDGYKELMRNIEDNLGWRIVTEFLGTEDILRRIIQAASTGQPASEIVNTDFKTLHVGNIQLLRKLSGGLALTTEEEAELKTGLGEFFEEVYRHFQVGNEEEESVSEDNTKPSILLRSFVGSKGLSAGHVFVLGANNGDIPKDPRAITDIEVCQFLVALTRTRKKCHVLSNRWYMSPKNPDKSFAPRKERSSFISWLPTEFVEDLGFLNAEAIKNLP